MSYKSGLPLFDDNRLKPGLVTHALCMQECLRRGLLEEVKRGQGGFPEESRNRSLFKYDFLKGERLYKEQLSNTKCDLIWITAPRGPRTWLIEEARLPFQLTRELLRSVKTGVLPRKATV
jgi:hypothetical protein